MNLDYACAYLAQYLEAAAPGARKALETLMGAVAALVDRNSELEAEVRMLRLQLEAERS